MTDDDIAKALSGLPREVPPPPGAEARTIAALRSAGFLGGRPRRWPFVVGGLLAIAASLVVGVWIGTRHDVRPAAGQEKFLLLLYEDASYQPPPAGAERARRAEYDAWAHALGQSGHMTVAEALSNEATQLQPGLPAARVARATSSGDSPDGFFLILAADEASAVAIARTCPHLSHGGRVRLWPIAPD